MPEHVVILVTNKPSLIIAATQGPPGPPSTQTSFVSGPDVATLLALAASLITTQALLVTQDIIPLQSSGTDITSLMLLSAALVNTQTLLIKFFEG